MELAKFIVEHFLDLNPKKFVPYVFLSNIYVMCSGWNKIENMQKMMKYRGIQNYLNAVGLNKIKSITK